MIGLAQKCSDVRPAWRKSCLSFAILAWVMIGSRAAHGQSNSTGVETYEEFGKRLRAAVDVSLLKSDLCSNRVSLYNGSADCEVADIDIPDNVTWVGGYNSTWLELTRTPCFLAPQNRVTR